MLRKNINRFRLLSAYFACSHQAKSFDEYFSFITQLRGGLFKPLQLRSEILGFLSLVETHKPKRVLGIGTANGGTLFLLARASACDATLISLDLPHGKYGGGYSPLRIPLYKQFAREKQKIQLIRGDSHDPANVDIVKKYLDGEKLDLLFIDGDHSYEGVKQDFELYLPLVRAGGLIGLHDVAVHPPGADCDVNRFWCELKEHYEYNEFIESTSQGWAGIGVVRLPGSLTAAN